MTKLEIEYIINSSSRILFDRLSTAEGLSEWFADDVIVQNNIYTFVWDGVEEQAELLEKKDLSHVKFRWLEEDANTYFEFRINTHDLTNELALIITDFAIDDEKEETIELWETQIGNLRTLLGA
ncbi:SRPBCC domain-containing protein [Bacteroidales bacterium OttesenSCG-928-I21]|nr:SRPBCC domain-containing protein [Bacteroidales bacterium OttesenSCG-928-I21]